MKDISPGHNKQHFFGDCFGPPDLTEIVVKYERNHAVQISRTAAMTSERRKRVITGV